GDPSSQTDDRPPPQRWGQNPAYRPACTFFLSWPTTPIFRRDLCACCLMRRQESFSCPCALTTQPPCESCSCATGASSSRGCRSAARRGSTSTHAAQPWKP